MTRDDIIRMAREAGLVGLDEPRSGIEEKYRYLILDFLPKFAALVAAAEREEMAINSIHSCHDKCQRPICVAIRKAVEAEREACAKVCDSFYESWIGIHGRYEFLGEGAQECAYAIRARGQNV